MATHFTPYDEDEIVGIVLDIFNALTRLRHFQHHPITYAPRTDLDLSLVSQEDAVIDDRVLSLMRRLPVPPAGDKVFITPNQIAVDYSSPRQLAFSRDIGARHCLGSHEDVSDRMIARPTDMVLFDEHETGDGTIILDTSENTIRVYVDELNDDFMRGDASQAEKPSHNFDYRNYPTQPAPAFLRGMLQDILDAKIISNMDGSLYPIDGWFTGVNPQHVQSLQALQRSLIEHYLWPSNEFRADEWYNDAPEMIANAFFPQELEGRPL